MFMYFQFLLRAVVVVSLFLPSSLQAMILEDSEAIKGMIRSGISANVIFEARKEQTPETITRLILAAAPLYPLKDILALYPSKTGKVDAKEPAETTPGENAFFEACKRSPKLYCDFFSALTRLHFPDGKNRLNSSQETISEVVRPVYVPISAATVEVKYVKHTQLETYFLSYKNSFLDAVNLAYLNRLLEISFSAPGLSLRKKNPDLSSQIQMIRRYAPFIRGEIALEVDRDLRKAWEFFSKAASIADEKDNFMLLVHPVEIQLGTYMNTMGFVPELLNENEGVKRLMKLPNNAIALLRLAEYYLGFFGHPVNEEKGLETIAKAAQREFSHIAYRVWADYHLGITNWVAHNMRRAKELLDLAFQKCDHIKGLEDCVNIRLGEIALGIFDKEEEGGEESTPVVDSLPEKNIPRAIEMFKSVVPQADIFLYRIYTGYYGSEFADPEAAQSVWDRLVATKNSNNYIQMKIAFQEYKKGNIAETVKIFERHNLTLMGAYALGCIKSNPLHLEFYNPSEAVSHFGYLYRFNFRDARARLCKLLLGESGPSVLPGYEAKAIRYLLASYNEGKTEFTTLDFCTHGIPLKGEIPTGGAIPEATNEISTVSSEPPSTISPGFSENEEESDVPSTLEGDITEEAVVIAQEVEAINEKAPLRILANEGLQDLYDSLGSCPKWRHLQEVVIAFGGHIDRKAQTMKLPHSEEIFTYHRPHSGNPPIALQGYWTKLKHMLDHEFEVRCQLQAEGKNEQPQGQ